MSARVLVYGDSNSWGCPPDGTGLRIARRWPVVMAEILGLELVEDALPGRTTIHDDAEMHGLAQNGLTHLPVSLLAAQPVDFVVIMLGTNDMKTRYEPSARKIAQNVMRLVNCVSETGGGPGAWGESPAPKVGVICPHILPEAADDPNWDRCKEWQGGREASLGLLQALRALAPEDVPILNAAEHVTGDPADPIHFGDAAHQALGEAAANWIRPHL